MKPSAAAQSDGRGRAPWLGRAGLGRGSERLNPTDESACRPVGGREVAD